MEILFIHLFKSSIIVILFLSCYYLFLKRETFFNGNRWFLLSGLIASLVLPFINITKTVFMEPIISSSGLPAQTLLENNTQVIDFSFNILWSWIFLIYCLGIVFFGTRLIKQLITLKNLIIAGRLTKEHRFYHVQTQEAMSPFSFFKYIFYFKSAFEPKELEAIIEHEKAHARGLHSLDILFVELASIFTWFNPGMWFYRKAIKQNLEFLADANSCSISIDEEKKFYQYLILKQVAGKEKLNIVNPFYNSLIKKRIIMLNQSRSKKTNMFKMLFIIPAIVLVMSSFNTNIEYVMQSDTQSHKVDKKQSKSINLTINKDTSNEELEKIKKSFKKDNIDFSYTAKHNNNDEIIGISLKLDGKNPDGKTFSGNYKTDSQNPIKPITIFFDKNTNMVSFGTPVDRKLEIHSDKALKSNVWISTGDKKRKEIVFREKNGIRKIFVDGKEISEDEFNKMNLNITIIPMQD